MSAISKAQLPERHLTRFPNFPLPVARLARLAVDTQFQRQGLGEHLLADALYRCHRLAGEIGMVGVIVDAKHEKAKAYYQRFEFETLQDAPLTLWLPVAAIAKLCHVEIYGFTATLTKNPNHDPRLTEFRRLVDVKLGCSLIGRAGNTPIFKA
jgi:hypothetical protein